MLLRGFPALRTIGFSYFTTTGNNTLHKPYHYGALGLMYGTVVIALIAVIVGVPLAIGVSLFLNEYAPFGPGGP